MQIRDLKKGNLFYWFHDEKFCVRFIDAENDTSYGEGDFEYLDVTRYNSARFVLNAMKALLDDAWKDRHDLDIDGCTHTISIGMLYARKNYSDLFTKYFPEYEVTWMPLIANNYHVEISTKKSLYHLLNFVNLMVVFIALRNSEGSIFIEPEMIEKYMSCLNILDAPYFIRYVFKVNFLIDFMLFEKYKPILEKTSLTEKIEMRYGSSQMARKNAVQKFIKFDKQIVDVGCGDGFYVSLCQKLKNKIYVAIDTDPAMLEVVRKSVERKGFKNVEFESSWETYAIDAVQCVPSDVLLIEVIEHMEAEKAKTLIETILSDEDTESLTITTPNADFNRFFLFEEGEFRHDDHKFEFKEEDFRSFINKSVGTSFNVTFFEAGDTVNGVCSTIGAHIRRQHD